MTKFAADGVKFFKVIYSYSVSKTLEYAYDDWCIAQIAKNAGYDQVYQEYIKRS